MLFAEHKHLLIQQRPIATLLTYRHDLDYDSGGGWEVRRLTGLLFQPEELVNGILGLALRGERFGFGDEAVDLFGEVAIGFEDFAGHGGGVCLEGRGVVCSSVRRRRLRGQALQRVYLKYG